MEKNILGHLTNKPVISNWKFPVAFENATLSNKFKCFNLKKFFIEQKQLDIENDFVGNLLLCESAGDEKVFHVVQLKPVNPRSV